MGASSLRISRLVQRVEEQRSEQATGAAEGKLLRDLSTALRELCEELTEGCESQRAPRPLLPFLFPAYLLLASRHTGQSRAQKDWEAREE